MSDIKLDEIHSMLKEKLTYQQIADHYGVNQGTIYNMIKREKQKRFQLPSRKAKEIIKQFEITDPPVDLKAIAKHEGFKLFFNKLPSNISGIIESIKKKRIFSLTVTMPQRGNALVLAMNLAITSLTTLRMGNTKTPPPSLEKRMKS